MISSNRINSSSSSSSKNHKSNDNDTDIVTITSSTSKKWIQLNDKKSFSRLLYTNPVCFLSSTTAKQQGSKHKYQSKSKNVMVVSWLTPTNNNGRFVMSINKRRHTSAMLLSDDNNDDNNNYDSNNMKGFVLSVPVAGMEELVLNVGKISGKWGRSKFPHDYYHHNIRNDSRSSGCDDEDNDDDVSGNNDSIHNDDNKDENQVMMNNKRVGTKMKSLESCKNGIHSLVAVKLGTCDEEIISNNNNDDDYHGQDIDFAIKGTVAHLKCIIYDVPSFNNKEQQLLIDDEHNLIMAEVVEAYVRNDYWNQDKKQFCPQIQPTLHCRSDGFYCPPPYLTFFGSQTFGYVSTTATP